MTADKEAGLRKIEWARKHMPVMAHVERQLKDSGVLTGIKIGMALHVEAKTAVLALSLKNAGADVRLAGCNPLSTDDDVVAALNDIFNLPTFARKGESNEEYYANLRAVLAHNPDYVIDDGGDLISLIHTEYPELLRGLRGANEETTTGIVRLRAMAAAGALKIPVMDVNDAMMKHLFDNRYGTGQSTFDGIFSATNLLIAGKNFVVGGYGWCGRGIAMRARGLGASVIVTEVDPIKAVEALHDGFRVMPMAEAVKEANFIVTATGVKNIVRKEHFETMKDGCVLANSGHFDNEIDVASLRSIADSKRVRGMVEEFTMPDGKTIYLLAEGRLVNLAAGQGHPVEIMDMSFAIQALSVEYLLTHRLDPGVHRVPAEMDERVARIRLESSGVRIDSLTQEQIEYINSWSEGT